MEYCSGKAERGSPKGRADCALSPVSIQITFSVDCLPAACELVPGSSTSAEIGDLLGRLKDRPRQLTIRRRGLFDNLFEILARPSDAGNFDIAVLRNPEN